MTARHMADVVAVAGMAERMRRRENTLRRLATGPASPLPSSPRSTGSQV
jgi:hypothetical protein